jgi:IMP dehydrogenase/GMP reductase
MSALLPIPSLTPHCAIGSAREYPSVTRRFAPDVRKILHTPLCDMLGIKYPILLAGMDGASTPELAAAVSNAGGLGILGAAALGPDDSARFPREIQGHA